MTNPAERGGSSVEQRMLKPGERIINQAELAELIDTNSSTHILNPQTLNIRFGGGNFFDPDQFASPQVVWVESVVGYSSDGKPQTKKKLRIVDGHHRAFVGFKHYETKEGKNLIHTPTGESLPFDFTIQDVTEKELAKLPPPSEGEERPTAALTPEAYAKLLIYPTRQQPGIEKQRYSNIIIDLWDNLVGPEVSQKYPALFALGYLDTHSDLKKDAPDLSKRIAARLDEEAVTDKEILKDALTRLTSSLPDFHLTPASAAKEILATIATHPESFGGEEYVRSQIEGLLDVPSIKIKIGSNKRTLARALLKRIQDPEQAHYINTFYKTLATDNDLSPAQVTEVVGARNPATRLSDLEVQLRKENRVADYKSKLTDRAITTEERVILEKEGAFSSDAERAYALIASVKLLKERGGIRDSDMNELEKLSSGLLRGQIEVVRGRMKELGALIQVLGSQNTPAKGTTRSAGRGPQGGYRAAASTRGSQRRAAPDEGDTATQQIEQLGAQIAKRDNTIAALRAHVERLEADREPGTGEPQTDEAALRERVVFLEEELTRKQETVLEAERRIAELTRSNTTLRGDLAESRQNVTRLDGQVRRLGEELDRERQRARAAERRVTDLEMTLERRDELIDRLRGDLDIARGAESASEEQVVSGLPDAAIVFSSTVSAVEEAATEPEGPWTEQTEEQIATLIQNHAKSIFPKELEEQALGYITSHKAQIRTREIAIRDRYVPSIRFLGKILYWEPDSTELQYLSACVYLDAVREHLAKQRSQPGVMVQRQTEGGGRTEAAPQDLSQLEELSISLEDNLMTFAENKGMTTKQLAQLDLLREFFSIGKDNRDKYLHKPSSDTPSINYEALQLRRGDQPDNPSTVNWDEIKKQNFDRVANTPTWFTDQLKNRNELLEQPRHTLTVIIDNTAKNKLFAKLKEEWPAILDEIADKDGKKGLDAIDNTLTNRLALFAKDAGLSKNSPGFILASGLHYQRSLKAQLAAAEEAFNNDQITIEEYQVVEGKIGGYINKMDERLGAYKKVIEINTEVYTQLLQLIQIALYAPQHNRAHAIRRLKERRDGMQDRAVLGKLKESIGKERETPDEEILNTIFRNAVMLAA